MIPNIPNRKDRAQFYAGMAKLGRMSYGAKSSHIESIIRYGMLLSRMAWTPEQTQIIAIEVRDAMKSASQEGAGCAL